MSRIGDIAKGILFFCCSYFLWAALVQAASGQTVIAAFMFVGFTIPLSAVLYGHLKERKITKDADPRHLLRLNIAAAHHVQRIKKFTFCL